MDTDIDQQCVDTMETNALRVLFTFFSIYLYFLQEVLFYPPKTQEVLFYPPKTQEVHFLSSTTTHVDDIEDHGRRKARSDRIALFTLVLLTFGSQLERA